MWNHILTPNEIHTEQEQMWVPWVADDMILHVENQNESIPPSTKTIKQLLELKWYSSKFVGYHAEN
jgi:hypothetical protein